MDYFILNFNGDNLMRVNVNPLDTVLRVNAIPNTFSAIYYKIRRNGIVRLPWVFLLPLVLKRGIS